PVAPLPLDHPRPPVRSLRGASLPMVLDSGLSASIRGLCRHEGTTLFTLLLACFDATLYCSGGGEDIVVGTDVAGRDRPELESLVGFFINNVALRIDLSGNPTFRELLGRVRGVALDALSHQNLPFDRLVEEMGVDRDPSVSPLFQ